MLRSLAAISIALIIPLYAGSVAAAPRPVIIIPGIEGSKICDGKSQIIWGDTSSYTFSRLKSLRLPFNVADRDSSIHSCGIIESYQVIPLLWEANVYSGLLATLKKPDFGYTENDLAHLMHAKHELKANFCKTRSSVSARVSSAD